MKLSKKILIGLGVVALTTGSLIGSPAKAQTSKCNGDVSCEIELTLRSQQSNYSVPSGSLFAQHAHLVNSEGLPQYAGFKDSFLTSKGYENDAKLFSYDLKIYSRLICGTAYTKCISNLEAKSYKSRAQLLSTGNGDLIGTRVVNTDEYYNYTKVTPWLVSSAYWPAVRYCTSIYGRPHAFNNAQRSCVTEQKRLAGY